MVRNCPYCGEEMERISSDEWVCPECGESFVDNELGSFIPLSESMIEEDDDDEEW